jgi:hypothetical protein
MRQNAGTPLTWSVSLAALLILCGFDALVPACSSQNPSTSPEAGPGCMPPDNGDDGGLSGHSGTEGGPDGTPEGGLSGHSGSEGGSPGSLPEGGLSGHSSSSSDGGC